MKALSYLCVTILLLSCKLACAQTLGNGQPSTPSSQDVSQPSEEADPLQNLFSPQKDTKDSTAPQTTSADSNVSTSTEDEEDVFIPEDELYRLNTPTVDGSKRGGEAFVMRDEQGRLKKVTNIFLFYDEFKIHHTMGNLTSCDVRFNIISNLDRKITQLDVKLVWPDMTTTLSFSDVPPFTQLYYNYTLLGKGCYSMDKAPNIVVNRCRAKGLTAMECAKKLLWVHK